MPDLPSCGPTPALDWLLRRSIDGIVPGPGYVCVDALGHCPFAVTPSREENHGSDVRNDRSEAHYRCTMLDRDVWGEEPACTVDQWKLRARHELGRA